MSTLKKFIYWLNIIRDPNSLKIFHCIIRTFKFINILIFNNKKIGEGCNSNLSKKL